MALWWYEPFGGERIKTANVRTPGLFAEALRGRGAARAGETDTDAADRFDASVSTERLDESMPGLWSRYRRLPRNVFAISLVSLLNDASSEIIYPFLPLFLALTLGASPFAIGLIEGGAESVSGLLKLFFGYYSDRRGRRKGLVVFGYGWRASRALCSGSLRRGRTSS